MQTKFKRHQLVRIVTPPDPEYIEFYEDKREITKGMKGKINILLPNGQYHVEILDEEGEALAYAPMSEDDLEAID